MTLWYPWTNCPSWPSICPWIWLSDLSTISGMLSDLQDSPDPERQPAPLLLTKPAPLPICIQQLIFSEHWQLYPLITNDHIALQCFKCRWLMWEHNPEVWICMFGYLSKLFHQLLPLYLHLLCWVMICTGVPTCQDLITAAVALRVALISIWFFVDTKGFSLQLPKWNSQCFVKCICLTPARARRHIWAYRL